MAPDERGVLENVVTRGRASLGNALMGYCAAPPARALAGDVFQVTTQAPVHGDLRRCSAAIFDAIATHHHATPWMPCLNRAHGANNSRAHAHGS